jgi:hypothetical protein
VALAPSTRLDADEVNAQICEGVIGQVYRVRDTKLNCDVVALVQPDSFASDAE